MVGPPAAGAFQQRPAKPTAFRKFYERGDFPIALEHDTKGNRIAWKVSLMNQQRNVGVKIISIDLHNLGSCIGQYSIKFKQHAKRILTQFFVELLTVSLQVY